MRRNILFFGIALAFMPTGANAQKREDTVYIYTVKDDPFSKSLSYTGLAKFINPLGGRISPVDAKDMD
jgi:hypothetical protein